VPLQYLGHDTLDDRFDFVFLRHESECFVVQGPSQQLTLDYTALVRRVLSTFRTCSPGVNRPVLNVAQTHAASYGKSFVRSAGYQVK